MHTIRKVHMDSPADVESHLTYT